MAPLNIDWSAPWLAPYRGVGESVDGSLRSGASVADALNEALARRRGTPGAAPITLQAATTQWFEALFSGGGSYAAALRAGQLAVEAHSRGQASPAPAAPTVSQWVDAVRYPNNPSCYFPPGR
jgi:hypothetical protein